MKHYSRDWLSSTSLYPPEMVPARVISADGDAIDESELDTRPDLEMPSWLVQMLESAGRVIHGANPQKRALVFKLQASDVMCAAGKVGCHVEAINWLQEQAEASGLVDELGQDGVQALLSEAATPADSEPPAGENAQAKSGELPPDGQRTKRSLISHRASDVVPEQIEWIWPGRIAAGKLTLIGGKPGLGKSQVTVHVAATVSTGGAWPCDEGSAARGSVIIFSAEDGIADTIVPRCIAAGGDLNKIEIVSGVRDERGRKTFDLKADIAALERKVAEIGDVRLILIDPISAYMGRADGNGNVETRGVLEPLAEMAGRLRVAVLAVTHLNKGAGSNQGTLERFAGSIAFVAAARAAFAIVEDEDHEGRILFLQVKNNLAPKQKGLAYTTAQRIVADNIVASSIIWGFDHVDVSADVALSAMENRNEVERTAKDEAIDLLIAILADGPANVVDIEAQARSAAMLSNGRRLNESKPFRAAAKELRIVKSHIGFGPGARWQWSLPADNLQRRPRDPIDAPSREGASMAAKDTYGVGEGSQ